MAQVKFLGSGLPPGMFNDFDATLFISNHTHTLLADGI